MTFRAAASINGGAGNITSVTGTANQITVTPTTGAVVVSLPNAITIPGSLAAVGAIAPAALIGITGTTTNNDVQAGSVGEFIQASAASPGTSLTTGTGANVTSISLTAGDWEVNGSIWFTGNAATTVSQVNASINIVTGTVTGTGVTSRSLMVFIGAVAPFAVNDFSVSVGATRLSLAATTTVYLIAQASFAVNTASAYGQIRARRVR